MSEFETRVAAAKREIRSQSVDGIQRRHALCPVEVRASEDGGYVIEGHGAVFRSLSENLGGFREQIEPGAFADVLDAGPDVKALFNHDQNFPLAATKNDTLALREDERGLHYRASVSANVAATYYGQAMRAQLTDGLVDQSSFAFRVAQGGDKWDEDPESGLLIRTITRFSGLYDVSPVLTPAYAEADSGIRSTTAPDVERVDDEPAGQRVHDGDGQERQADKGFTLAFVRRDLEARERMLRA